jgi:Carbohydrate esterase, sialic acid-specific acetylesterase
MSLHNLIKVASFLFALHFCISASAVEQTGAEANRQLSRTEGKAPDQTKKVRVFILMGQSNMVGMGDIQPEDKPGTLTHLIKTDKKYPFLVDGAGNWTVRKNVYYYDARLRKGGYLSATSNNGKSIGPELGFGCVMGDVLDGPVLLIKSCIGNRSLGWDLLPPGSERYVVDGKTYAGYKDTPAVWIEGQPKQSNNWYAGKEYDLDLENVKAALAELGKIYPDYKSQGYEIAGFVWWQGHKDHFSPVYADRYEFNLANLIKNLRTDYHAPNAKFVLATGCGNPGRAGLGLQIAEAQLAVADAKKHPEFAGSVKCIDSRCFWPMAAESPNPKQDYHYYRNAGTYMEVGLGLGWAMADLLKNK